MNIALIGMPGSGKTFVGKALADTLGYVFVDPDKVIEAQYGKPLQEVLEDLGDEAFLIREYEATKEASRGRNHCVISTGGSIVYTEAAMDYLADIGFIIYLEVPLATLIERTGNKSRGIVGIDKKTLEELFRERDMLYRKWANVAVNADQPVEDVLRELISVIPKA